MIKIDRLFVTVMLLLSEIFKDYQTNVTIDLFEISYKEILKSEPFYKIKASYPIIEKEDFKLINELLKKQVEENILLMSNIFKEYKKLDEARNQVYEFNLKITVEYKKSDFVSMLSSYSVIWSNEKIINIIEGMNFDLRLKKKVSFEDLVEKEEFLQKTFLNKEEQSESLKCNNLSYLEYYINYPYIVLIYPDQYGNSENKETKILIDSIRNYLKEDYKLVFS